jgi:hypothetical protein
VFPVKYELGFHIPEDGILHSHRRENLKSYNSPAAHHFINSSHSLPRDGKLAGGLHSKVHVSGLGCRAQWQMIAGGVEGRET